MRPLLFLASAATLLSACSLLDDRVCTAIGCIDGITLHLDNLPQQSFTVTALVDGEEHQAIECAAGTCQRLFLEDITAEEVTLVFATATATWSETITPAYARVQPNGPGCPPVCHQATVYVTLP